MSFRYLSCIVGGLLRAGTLGAQVVPALMNYQGRVSELSGAVNPTGEFSLSVRFWDAEKVGNLIWGPQVFDGVLDEGHGAKVRFEQGFFQFVIGPTDTEGRPLNSAFDVEEVFLELEMEGALVGRRQRILSAPYALRAQKANESESSLSADGLKASDGQAYGWEVVFESGDPESGQLREGLSGAGLGDSGNALLLDLMRENLEAYPWPVFDQELLQKYQAQLNRLKDFSCPLWETPDYQELRRRLETETAYSRDYQVDYGFLPGERSIQMRWVEPGEFEMGSPGFEVDRGDQEGPVTQVQLTQGFWMSRHEVTQLQWESLMGTTLEDQLALTSSGWPPPSEEPTLAGQGFNHPMYFVSHDEAMEFCQRLTANEKEAGRLPNGWHYSLPTEAEWEYVCRAGSISRFHFGDDIGYLSLGNFDWFEGNASETQPVGGKLPNPWGFYDMHGNVSEICLDWYSGLPGAKAVDPIGIAGRLVAKVFKGGSYKALAAGCRSAVRFSFSENARASTHGFRIVLRKDLVEPERSFIVRTVKESNEIGVPPALLDIAESIEMVWVEPGTFTEAF